MSGVNRSNKLRQEKLLFDRLETLTQEERAIRKGLEYVRLARQKNKIERLEIQSKIKELVDRIQNSETEKMEVGDDTFVNNSRTINTRSTKCSDVFHFDDAAKINKTKLNLDVNYSLFGFEEGESEESD